MTVPESEGMQQGKSTLKLQADRIKRHMKMRKLLFVLLLAIIATSQASAQIYSLPYTQDFENGLQGWSTSNTPCGLINDASQSHLGEHCYKYCGLTDGSTGNQLFLFSPNLGSLNADTVRVTFYARGGANVSIMRIDNTPGSIPFAWVETTTQEWQQYTVAVPTGRTSVLPFIMFYSNASSAQPLWIDDIMLTYVEHDVVDGNASMFSRLDAGGHLLYYGITSDTTVSVVSHPSNWQLQGDIVIPPSVIRQGNTYTVTAIGDDAFNGSSITSIVLPATIDAIGNYAFFGCYSLTTCAIPEGVRSIGAYAFAYCGNTSIYIPSTVEDISTVAFHGMPNVGTVTVSADNTHYMAADNVLFDFNQAVLIFYAPQKPNTHYDIPATVSFVMSFYDCDNLTSVSIPTSVDQLFGFEYCDGLTEINIPANVSYVGTICRNSSLTAINVADGNPYYCDIDGVLFDKQATLLKSYPPAKVGATYTIPNTVNTIGWQAFLRCSNLTTAVIPESVETIQNAAFSEASIPSLDIPSSVTYIEYNAFYNIFNINYTGSATYDEWDPFWGAKHMNLPFYAEDSLYYTSSAKDTVVGCHPYLHSAVLPESVSVIADSAFFNLPQLSSVALPDGLEKIGMMAFAWDHGLTEVTIPHNVKYIGDNAFWWDTNLVVLNFNADSCTTMCIGWHNDGQFYPVFIGCDNLATINIGANVKHIPDFAFSYCGGLMGTLTIPDAVTAIGEYAFYYNGISNDSLHIVIGSSVKTIGDYAFYRYDHLASVTSRNPVPPTIQSSTFLVYEHIPLTVPCGSRDAYIAKPLWKEFELYGSGIFEDCDGIDDNDDDNTVNVYAQNGCIIIASDGQSTPQESYVYSIDGRLVARGYKTAFNVPASGVYIVRVGNQATRKVVVIK